MNNVVDEPGTLSWVVLTTEDTAAAGRFYRGLLSWQGPSTAGSGAMQDVYLLRGRAVAGISAKAAACHSAWRIYLSTADAEKTARAVISAGGRVVQEPTALGKAGRFAVFADHSGAQFAVWQAGEFEGAAVHNESGSVVWSELITDDVTVSADFYGAVFGWELTSAAPSDPSQRREWNIRGRSIAGLLPRPPAMPKEIPPYWDVMFGVADPAAAVETAVRLGAKNLMPPTNIAHGRIAVFADPVGTLFSVLAPKTGAAQ